MATHTNRGFVFVRVKGDDFGPLHKYPVYPTLDEFLQHLSEEFNISTVNLSERIYTENEEMMNEEIYQSLTQNPKSSQERILFLLDIKDLQTQQHSQSFQDESEPSETDDEDELFLGLDTFTSKQNKMILEEVQKQGIDQYATFDNLDGEEENL